MWDAWLKAEVPELTSELLIPSRSLFHWEWNGIKWKKTEVTCIYSIQTNTRREKILITARSSYHERIKSQKKRFAPRKDHIMEGYVLWGMNLVFYISSIISVGYVLLSTSLFSYNQVVTYTFEYFLITTWVDNVPVTSFGLKSI